MNKDVVVHVRYVCILCNIKTDKIFLFFFVNKDERSDKRNQILQKAVANWLNSEGNTDAAFMVGEFKCFSFIFSFFSFYSTGF